MDKNDNEYSKFFHPIRNGIGYLPVFDWYGDFEGFGKIQKFKCVGCGFTAYRVAVNYHYSAVEPNIENKLVILQKQAEYVSQSGATYSKPKEIRIVKSPKWAYYPKGSRYVPDGDWKDVGNDCLENKKHPYRSQTYILYNEVFELDKFAIEIPTLCNGCTSNIKTKETPIYKQGHLFLFKLRETSHQDTYFPHQISIFNHIFKEADKIPVIVKDKYSGEYHILIYVPKEQEITSKDHVEIKIEPGVYLAIHPFPSRNTVD